MKSLFEALPRPGFLLVGLIVTSLIGILLWCQPWEPARITTGQQTEGDRSSPTVPLRAPARDAEPLRRLALPALVHAEEKSVTAECACAFRVLNEFGTPIPGATLRLSVPGEPPRQAVTDGEGRASVTLAWNNFYIVCAAEGHATATERWDSPAAETGTKTITLRPAARLWGAIDPPAASAPAAGVLVVAWPAGADPPTAAALVEGLNSGTNLHAVRTDATGSFEFTDLDPRQRYCVIAGGRGYASRWPVRGVAPSAEPVPIRMPVHNAFVAGVVLGGLPESIRGSIRAGHLPPFTLAWTCREENVYPATMSSPAVALADETKLLSSSDGAMWNVLLSDRDQDQVLEVDFSATLPGYAGLRTTLQARSIRAPATPQDVLLTPVSSANCTLLVTFSTGEPVPGNLVLAGPYGTVSYPVGRGDGPDQLTLAAGRYRWHFVASNSGYVHPQDQPAALDLAEGKATDLRVECGGLGSIEVIESAAAVVSWKTRPVYYLATGKPTLRPDGSWITTGVRRCEVDDQSRICGVLPGTYYLWQAIGSGAADSMDDPAALANAIRRVEVLARETVTVVW